MWPKTRRSAASSVPIPAMHGFASLSQPDRSFISTRLLSLPAASVNGPELSRARARSASVSASAYCAALASGVSDSSTTSRPRTAIDGFASAGRATVRPNSETNKIKTRFMETPWRTSAVYTCRAAVRVDIRARNRGAR
jgi:hypothetical protein